MGVRVRVYPTHTTKKLPLQGIEQTAYEFQSWFNKTVTWYFWKFKGRKWKQLKTPSDGLPDGLRKCSQVIPISSSWFRAVLEAMGRECNYALETCYTEQSWKRGQQLNVWLMHHSLLVTVVSYLTVLLFWAPSSGWFGNHDVSDVIKYNRLLHHLCWEHRNKLILLWQAQREVSGGSCNCGKLERASH